MPEISEWEIENFGCWIGGIIHDDCLTESCDDIELYPKGVGGKTEHIVVSMDVALNDNVKELSFIGSDGSVICTRRPDHSRGGRRVFTGPKFEEVVAGIRRNEPLHEDRLILRWEIQNRWLPRRSRTVIEAYTAFFHIKPEVFDLKKHKRNLKDTIFSSSEMVPNIHCFRDREQCIDVSAKKTGSTLEDAKLEFHFASNLDKKTLARTSIWMLNGDNITLKNENDRILPKGNHYIPPYCVPLKELQGLKTIICCKLITGHSSRNWYYIDTRLPPDLRIACFSKFSEIKSLVNAVVSDATRETKPRESQPGKAVTALSNDFSCLYQDHDFSDFKLRCGTASFPTHRGILCARSPVFKAMLSGDRKEIASGQLEVEDLDPHTLGRFLAFLYSGTSGENLEWEEAIQLYYAADKYQVPSLVQECAAVLCGSVSLENVCDILSLADKHKDEELGSVAHDFILKNYNEVLGSENWEKLMSSDPLLVAKTLTHFAKSNYVQKRGLITEQRGRNGKSSAKRAKTQDF